MQQMAEKVESFLIDRVTLSQRPSDQQIKQWASNKRVFISSTMDDLVDVRQSVAATITEFGAQPVMFETLGARSDDSRQAYTSEVRRSQIYLGILSRRYGTKLPSGYSATHEEYEEAGKHQKEILLFLDAMVPDAERDGHLNRWIKELYQFHVLAKYRGMSDLVQKVKTSLDEIARDELTPWVKLDRAIFQATRIAKATQGQTTIITITTASRDPRITVELTGIVRERFVGTTNRRLTFRRESFEVQVLGVEETIDPLGNDSLVLTCKTVDGRYQRQRKHPLLQMGGGYSGPSGSYEYRDLVRIALRCVALGEHPPSDSLLASLPRIDFSALYQRYGDDAQIFPRIVQLLTVEAVYQHGIVDKLVHISVGKVREGRSHVRLSAMLPRFYSNVEPEMVELEGDIVLR
jgi:hypothetical protein